MSMPNGTDNRLVDHAGCATFIKAKMRQLGCEITVSHLPPLVQSHYNQDGIGHLTCPHGTTFYFEPTSEQIAEWARDGVA